MLQMERECNVGCITDNRNLVWNNTYIVVQMDQIQCLKQKVSHMDREANVEILTDRIKAF